MAKEDILLREEMGRLEIEPIKLNKSRSDENPFLKNSKRTLLKRTSAQRSSCSCSPTNTNNGICKKKHNKILKESVLHIVKTCVANNVGDKEDCKDEVSTTHNINTDPLNLCTLVKTCNQLKISNGLNNQIKSKNDNDKTKWWKNEVSCSGESREQRHSNQAGSCSQQALNPQCDITIDELASYFETLVHIPKKMSSMAEMMYI